MTGPALKWRARALLDLGAIYAYIARDNPDAARAIKDEIQYGVARLPLNPRLHPQGRRPGTREMLIRRRYVVVYAENPRLVTVLRIVHTSMNYV